MNYKSSYSQGLQHSLTLFPLVMEPFWRLKPRLDFVNRAMVLMIVDGRDSLRFQHPLLNALISLTKRIGGGPLVLISQKGQLESSSGSPRSPTRTHVIGCHLRRLNITPCLGSALSKSSISYIVKYSSIDNLCTEFR